MAADPAFRDSISPHHHYAPFENVANFPLEAVSGTLTERFFEIASENSSHLAISAPAGQWSYAEVADRVTRLAGGLQRELGGASRTPIALLATHDAPLVCALLAVMASGNIVVILDPTAPLDQLCQQVDACSARHLLHDAEFAELASQLTSQNRRIRCLNLDSVDRGDYSPVAQTATDPAMLAFTSGTSGAPKAAIITHGVILNCVRGATDLLGVTSADRIPMLFPPSLAVAAYPLFIPLLNGGTLATLDVRAVGLAPIGEFLEREEISLAYMAPTVVRFLVDALEGRQFPSLRLVALGGELVDQEVVSLTRELLHPTEIAVGYGTTETGVVALHIIDPSEPIGTSVPVGEPVADVRIAIVDNAGQVAESGEIVVASPHMFLGYWGHPELNRQVLFDDLDGKPGWTCYRTGDFGRWNESGTLQVLGRVDTKVKVRGRFVVIGDVEAQLHAVPEIADAAVTAGSFNAITELIAHVVPVDPEHFDAAAVRAQLLETNETFRVPSRWAVVDELPRLPNGKLDRRSLRVPTSHSNDGTAGVSNRNPSRRALGQSDLREAVREIWQTLLPVGSIGMDEDFFHLGGDSLMAAQMLILLERRLGLVVPMSELLHARTVRDLAEVIARRAESSTDHPSVVACVQVGDESSRPRLWFVPDLQGSAWRVRHVASAMNPAQPVWSFESPLLRGEPNDYRSLAIFAARYVTDLRRSQPDGPYYLAGYSFGGVCAYEMARQLVRDGQEVAFLGVVDVGPGYRGPGWHDQRSPFRPWFGVAHPPPPGTSLLGVARHYATMWGNSRSGTLRHLMIRSGMARVIDPLRFQRDLRRHGQVRPEWRLWYSWEEHWKLAAKSWDRSNSFDGRLDLFWASESPSTDATMGWGTLVSQLEITRFDGNHESILEEAGAPALAAALAQRLDESVRERSANARGSGGTPE